MYVCNCVKNISSVLIRFHNLNRFAEFPMATSMILDFMQNIYKQTSFNFECFHTIPFIVYDDKKAIV